MISTQSNSRESQESEGSDSSDDSQTTVIYRNQGAGDKKNAVFSLAFRKTKLSIKLAQEFPILLEGDDGQNAKKCSNKLIVDEIIPPCTCCICNNDPSSCKLLPIPAVLRDEARVVDAERHYLSREARELLTWLREREVPILPSHEKTTHGLLDTPCFKRELLTEVIEKQNSVDLLLVRGEEFLSKNPKDIKLQVDLENLKFFWKTFLHTLNKEDKSWPEQRSGSAAIDRKSSLISPRSCVLPPAIEKNGGNRWTEYQSEIWKQWKSNHLKTVEKNSHQNPREVTRDNTINELPITESGSSKPEESKGYHFVNNQVDSSIYPAESTSDRLPAILYKACSPVITEAMEGTVTRSTRSPLRRGEGSPKSFSPTFDFSGMRDKKFIGGSNPELVMACPDSPPEAKRRRIMDDLLSLSSTVSSQVSSRSHSPTLSESTIDDSYVSTPGNSPAATLKDHFKRRYSKYELMIESDLMDLDLVEACKSKDSDEEDVFTNTKVSLTEFTQQYRELSEWLNQVLQVTKRTLGTLALSEKYLTQSYHEELLKQSPRHKLFNDYAKQLLQRRPSLKEEITQRLNHVNSQWEAVEKAVSCKEIWQDKEAMYKDLETDIVNLNRWLEDVEHRLYVLSKPPVSDEDTHRKLLEHQVLQRDITSHSRNVNAVLKLSEHLQDELPVEHDPNRLYLERSANSLQQRWHTVWLQGLEGQCKLENALKTKKATFPSPKIFTGWAPGLLNFHDHDKSGSSLSGDDSIGILTRGADLAESPPYPDDSLSLSQNSESHSGKDSAVASEVDCSKMSSEYSDSDLDMYRKTRLKSEGRDIGYSSGTTESLGHISTESDGEDIRKLIAGADKLITEGRLSPSKTQHPHAVESSCDASSEDSDGLADRYSTASDEAVREQDLLFDSVLGLDYNSDASLPHNLPRFHDTVKLRQYKQRKDRPWSAIQLNDIGDDFDISSLSRSDTAIDRLSYGSDQLSATPVNRYGGTGSSATFPRAGAKRKLCLYESSPVEGSATYSSDSDTESATSEDYETAQTDIPVSEEEEEEEEDGMNSTASFSEPAWDNYHQVYTSLGTDPEEQPLTWQQLEDDLEFDEEFSTLHSSSLIAEALERRKKEGKSKPRLLTQSSRQGYDSDSDLEDLHCFLEDSAHQLKITDRCLMKRRKDQFRTGIALHTSKYAEIIATCDTNMKCLKSVYDHLPADATEEETEKLKDMLYQWEKLHAFACDRQQQSQILSQLSQGLQDVQTTLRNCDVESTHYKFSHISQVENCLKRAQRNRELLLDAQDKLGRLQEKTDLFTKEHSTISLDVLNEQLKRADLVLQMKLERVHQDLPTLQHIYNTWTEYLMLRGELGTRLTDGLCQEMMAALEGHKNGESVEMKNPEEIMKKVEEMVARLQTLRGQLLPHVDDQAKNELDNSFADLIDQLSEVQRNNRLLQSVDQYPVEELIQRTDASKSLAALPTEIDDQTSNLSSSTSFSSPTSWLRSRYVKAAAVFMMMGVAYIVDPNLVKKIGDFTVTISPELRYVNGPPPI